MRPLQGVSGQVLHIKRLLKVPGHGVRRVLNRGGLAVPSDAVHQDPKRRAKGLHHLCKREVPGSPLFRHRGHRLLPLSRLRAQPIQQERVSAVQRRLVRRVQRVRERDVCECRVQRGAKHGVRPMPAERVPVKPVRQQGVPMRQLHGVRPRTVRFKSMHGRG